MFSLGLNVLGDEIRDHGVYASVNSGPQWPDIEKQIEGLAASGSSPGPIVLIGHSYGADDAVSISRQLAQAKIKVDLLVLIDATKPAPIPSNVEHAIHYYIPSVFGDEDPEAFAGNPVVPADGNTHTVIENLIYTTEYFGDGARGADHFSIEESPYLHTLIIDQIMQLCPSNEK